MATVVYWQFECFWRYIKTSVLGLYKSLRPMTVDAIQGSTFTLLVHSHFPYSYWYLDLLAILSMLRYRNQCCHFIIGHNLSQYATGLSSKKSDLRDIYWQFVSVGFCADAQAIVVYPELDQNLPDQESMKLRLMRLVRLVRLFYKDFTDAASAQNESVRIKATVAAAA